MEQLPHNPDSERHLIGLTLLEKHIPQGAREIAVTDFYNLNYRQAWRAFLELDADGQEIDHIAAHGIMQSNGANFTAGELANTTMGMMVGVNERVFTKTIK